MISLDEAAGGILLPVKAQAGARRNGIQGKHAGYLKITVTQAPEKGKANDAIIILLANLLNLKRSQIELAAGQTSSLKKFRITGITRADLEQKLAIAMSNP